MTCFKGVLVFCLLILSSVDAWTRDFVMVTVAGFGTRTEDRPWQPSGVHDLMPQHPGLVQSHKLVHYVSSSDLQAIVDDFDCREGRQRREGLGLIISMNSWGVSKGHLLARMYQEQCGRPADFVVVVDGVAKPLGRFTRPFASNKCLNYYQQTGVIRGDAIEGCENHDLTDQCRRQQLGPIDCHIYVEWQGAELARRRLQRFLSERVSK